VERQLLQELPPKLNSPSELLEEAEKVENIRSTEFPQLGHRAGFEA